MDLDTKFSHIGDVKAYVAHHGGIKMFRNKDTPSEIVVLVVVPEELGRNCDIHMDRGSYQMFRQFFRSVVQVLVEGFFRSIIMPIPGWHSHPTWIETACRSLCQVLVKHGSTLDQATQFTMIHSNMLVIREWNGEMENLYLAHKDSWKFLCDYRPIKATVSTPPSGLEVSSVDHFSSVLSTVGPSASMGVQAPQLDSAIVVSNVESPPLSGDPCTSTGQCNYT